MVQFRYNQGRSQAALSERVGGVLPARPRVTPLDLQRRVPRRLLAEARLTAARGALMVRACDGPAGSPAASWLEVVYPFSKLGGEVLDAYLMPHSESDVRWGRLMEEIDALSADVAYRHCTDHEDGGKDKPSRLDSMEAMMELDLDVESRVDLEHRAVRSLVARATIVTACHGALRIFPIQRSADLSANRVL